MPPPDAGARRRAPGKALRVALLGFLGRLVYGVIAKTVRPIFGPDGALVREAMASGEPVIFAFFHGQLAMMQPPYEGRRGLAIQMSMSDDGEIIARTIEPYGIRAVRGSSSRRNVASLKAMVTAMEEGRDLAFACDGPRGPFQTVKNGVVFAGMMTGARIFPVAAAPRRGITFHESWDRFTVPLPFTRVFVVLGEPIQLARDADDDALEIVRKDLEAELRRLSREAERRAGRTPGEARHDPGSLPRSR